MRREFVWLMLSALVVWVHSPLFSGGVLGAPHTDLVRGIWGFDQQARNFPYFAWTDRVGFPEGTKLVVLPFVSSLLGTPLHAILGPWNGYSAWMVALTAAGAIGTAEWVRSVSGSAASGLLAGGAMVTQPLLLLAETEGTSEHVAYWALPVLLLCLHQASGPRARWFGAAAGAAGFALALDNPYAAVFAVPLSMPGLWRADRSGRLAFLATAAAGAGVLAALYHDLPVTIPVPQRNANAVSLLTWGDWEFERQPKPWDFTHPPSFIPALGGAVAAMLAAFGGRRALTWTALAAGCFMLSLGSAEENGVVLAGALGPAGAALANTIGWFNDHVSPSMIRFPRRWLLPSAFCLWTAAGIGLSRLPKEWMRTWAAVPILVVVSAQAIAKTGFHQAFPIFDPPIPAFAAGLEGGSAVILPSTGNGRDFLGLAAETGDSTLLFVQIASGVALVNGPPGLLTARPQRQDNALLAHRIQALDALSRADAGPEAKSAARRLATAGVRSVVADDAYFGGDGLQRLTIVLAESTENIRHFADGAGVTVFTLRR